MDKNKHKWKYYFETQLIGGNSINHRIVTDLGKKCAEELAINLIDEYCETNNEQWFWFYLLGREKV